MARKASKSEASETEETTDELPTVGPSAAELELATLRDEFAKVKGELAALKPILALAYSKGHFKDSCNIPQGRSYDCSCGHDAWKAAQGG